MRTLVPDRAEQLETQESRSRKLEQLQAWLGGAAQRALAENAALVVRQGDSVKVLSHYPQDGTIEDRFRSTMS